jgi:protein-S-isoprenylcysteine O-methyltransferase Ste14
VGAGLPLLTLRSVIDILAIAACSVYCTIPLFWLVVHPFIDSWRKKGRHAYRLILPIWAVFIVATLLVVWPFRFSRFYIGFSVYSQAFQGFRREQVSGLAELEPDRHRQELVTTGIRARVRHPIYLGHLCEILGWCVGSGLMPVFALAGFAIVTGAVMIRIEDRELGVRFGAPYRAYRCAVPAVIPRLRQRTSLQ